MLHQNAKTLLITSIKSVAKMLKHMLTTRCSRRCKYCITRNIKSDDCNHLGAIRHLYDRLVDEGHREIMLTGGEPSSATDFAFKVDLAYRCFDKVHMTTQNRLMIDGTYPAHDKVFDSIVYSLHDDLTDEQVGLHTTKVYGAILDTKWYPRLPHELKARGFAGLTINEEQREGKPFKARLPKLRKFSIRINRVGHCMNETIILPNLQIIKDFTPYL